MPEHETRRGKPEMGKEPSMDEQEQQQEVPQEQAPVETPEPDKGDDFKSEESKRAVLADLTKERTRRKELEEEIARRDREQLSDLEKAQAERDEFRTKWEQAEQARLRSDIARTKGVDPGLLHGSTEEEMTAYADQLLAWRGDKPTPPPNPNPAQGAGNDQQPQSEDDQLYNTLYPKS